MRDKLKRYGPLLVALSLAALCACVIMIYLSPREDVFYDLSLMSGEDRLVVDTEQFDNKGWTVYTQEGGTRTELTPDGYGGYSGLELGQTFYLSRVLNEELDSPTLQLSPTEWNFSVWLDDVLIYTDCPEQDNRVGYLHLPLNDQYREEPVIISLPDDYQGRTLTIAQSFPEWSGTGRVTAYPTSVQLYSDYARESELVTDTFRFTLLSILLLLLTLVLLIFFVRSRDWKLLCLATAAFFRMLEYLVHSNWYHRYYESVANSATYVLPMVVSICLFCFLTLHGGTPRKWLWALLGGYALSVVVSAVILSLSTYSVSSMLTDTLPHWLESLSLIAILAMGTIRWRRESRFYRWFIPLAFAGIALCWLAEAFENRGTVLEQIRQNLASGQVLYLYTNTLPGVIAAAMIAAIIDAVKTELDHRSEQQLIEQRQSLTLASYENLRRQHEEVMMMRHDMLRHLHTLREMGDDEKRSAYLTELIGQNQKIRPVVKSGNEMMDIILNGKLSAALDEGIRIEIPHVAVPANLPLSDPDLCALIMNIVDNAITAASSARSPYILLKIHARDGFLGIVCENSFTPQEKEAETGNEKTVPEHGWGLKIVKGIVARYSGTITEKSENERFIVKIAIPL